MQTSNRCPTPIDGHKTQSITPQKDSLWAACGSDRARNVPWRPRPPAAAAVASGAGAAAMLEGHGLGQLWCGYKFQLQPRMAGVTQAGLVVPHHLVGASCRVSGRQLSGLGTQIVDHRGANTVAAQTGQVVNGDKGVL